MKIEILVSEDKKSYSIALDGGEPHALDNFVLLTKEGEMTRNLVFGRTETVGRLLFGLYANCRKFEEAEMGRILEAVAADIRESREQREAASEETIRRLN